MHVAVRVVGQTLWDREDSGEFDLSATVSTGDIVDFLVSTSNGNHTCGTTPLIATITLANQDTPHVETSLASKGSWSPTNGLAVSGTSASGTRALVCLGNSELRLLDLSNPAAPVALGAWSTLLPLSDAVLVGNLAYIASWEASFLSTIEIVDFTDPAKPVRKGYYDTAGYATDVVVRNNIAFVADAEGGLLILDVGDPARPRRLGGYDTKGSVQHVEVSGNCAFVPDGNWLVILNVSDPANPQRVGLYEAGGAISSLKASGTKLYLSEATGDLRILEVSNPGNIQLVGTSQGWGNGVQAAAVTGRFLYLAKGGAGLQVLDVSDPAKPAYLTATYTNPAEDLALMGNYVLVAGGDKGLLVYELQQHVYPPLNPPVISGGLVTLSWPAMEGVRLQKAASLSSAMWVDVAGSEGTNTVSLPMTDATAFFRLVKP